MILDDATKEAFGYYASELKPKSNKLIIVVCELCGNIRILKKSSYRLFCIPCMRFLNGGPNLGKKMSESQKYKISIALKTKYKYEKHPNNRGGTVKCVCLTCGTKFYVPKCRRGKYCCRECADIAQKQKNLKEKNPNWRGGTKASTARSHAKRKELGFVLLSPLIGCEEGHHVTNEYVIGIPAKVHQSLGGDRKKHRTLVLQWLKANDKHKYKRVLCVLAKESLKVRM